MKFVLDTDVIIAGLRSPTGASRQLLLLLHQEKYVALTSVSMMLEYEAVLKRPENLDASNLSLQDATQFLDSMSGLITPVTSFFLWRPQLRDPADEHVLETAVNGGADALVTFNVRHFRSAAHRFSIDLLRPSDALQRLRLSK